MLNIHPAILIIIAANVIVSMIGFNNREFFSKYMFHIGGIQRGEKLRMLTSGFLHANWMHLFFNLFTLYFFAPIVIGFLGVLNFVIIYFASLLLGSVFSYFFHQKDYNYSAIGASGAVMGILYSAIIFVPTEPLYLYGFIELPAFVFGIGYLLYSIYGMKSANDNIGHDAHFGGAVAGYVLTLVMAPSLFQTNLMFVGLLAIPIIILFILFKTGKL